MDRFGRRSSLELEPWRINCKWFYSHSPSCRERKEKGFEREEEDGEDEEMGLG